MDEEVGLEAVEAAAEEGEDLAALAEDPEALAEDPEASVEEPGTLAEGQVVLEASAVGRVVGLEDVLVVGRVAGRVAGLEGAPVAGRVDAPVAGQEVGREVAVPPEAEVAERAKAAAAESLSTTRTMPSSSVSQLYVVPCQRLCQVLHSQLPLAATARPL